MERFINQTDYESKTQEQPKNTISPQVNALIVAGEILGNQRFFKIFTIIATTQYSPIEIAKTTRIPYASVYKFIKKLAETGIVAKTRGLNNKKTYYTLTPLGIEVLKRLRELIAKHKNVYTTERTAITSISNFKEIADKLGISVDQLARILDAKIRKLDYGDPYRDIVGNEACTWSI